MSTVTKSMFVPQLALLETKTKRQEQKYLILLSNQVVIIDSEWPGMKRAIKHGKPIIEMMETYARIHAQERGLSNLLESLDAKINEEETNLKKSKYRWKKM